MTEDENEAKAYECPTCGHEVMHCSEEDDCEAVAIHWECEVCGTSGEAIYVQTRTFQYHYKVRGNKLKGLDT